MKGRVPIDMLTKQFLNEALQVGPWRVARKHLLFVITFSLFVVVFGVIVIETHPFSVDDEEEEDDDDNYDEEDWDLTARFSSGDWLLVGIISISGILAAIAAAACLFAKKNSPTQFTSGTESQREYSVQYNKDAQSHINSTSRTAHTVPQPITIWSRPIAQQQQQPADLSQQSHKQEENVPYSQREQTQSVQQSVLPGQPRQDQQRTSRGNKAKTSRIHSTPSAPPQTEIELPPPYSP